MSQEQPLNIYSPTDLPAEAVPAAPRVFISHRQFDKPLAAAVVAVLDQIGLHYWFDRDDSDIAAAVELGMAGDQALVHAIERGIRHSTHLLGLLSADTRGSWWVPYEVGFSRSASIPVLYLVLDSIRAARDLPEYVRLGANFWSVDELVHWAGGLSSGRGDRPSPTTIDDLARFVPRRPPAPTARELASQALTTIDRLAEPSTWTALALTDTTFSWLPTSGGVVRDLAYDLFAPLAFRAIHRVEPSARDLLNLAFLAPTRHHRVAEADPALPYSPEVDHWRRRRYEEPRSIWLQGLTTKQLHDRLHRFLVVDDLDQKPRLATREEFKAEFDRVLSTGSEQDRRSLGVLMNPLFGFTPTDRPVFWRVLALQHRAYSRLLQATTPATFDETTTAVAVRLNP